MLSHFWNGLVAWTGTLVAPDWGALVALIPLVLLVVVGAFVVITALKWAGAGPTRRGPRRRSPLAPDGTTVRGPVAGPLLVAVSGFLLAFGLVAGGPWPAVGIGGAAVGLTVMAAGGRRPAAPGPPEPTTTGQGSGSGSSPSESRRGRPRVAPARAVAVVAVAVVAVILVATARIEPDTPAGSTPTAPPVSAAATASLPPADVDLAAQGIAWVQTELEAPAGRSFTVAFDNRDNAPHNLEIRDASGTVVFLGDIVTGPVVTVYDVPALPAGQYPFVCTVHPAMTGTLTVK